MPVITTPPQLPVTVTQRETAIISNAYDEPARLFESIKADSKWQSRVALERLTNVIADLRTISDGWDGECAPRPSNESLDLAWSALEQMYEYGLTPSGVVPSVEGGAAIAFVKNAKYAHLEFLNDGNVLTVAYEGDSTPDVHEYSQELPGVISAIERIRSFIS